MNNQTSIPGMEEHELEQQAFSQLNATHYKEAIRLFKKLLLTSENAEWRQQLAHCYVQRAIQFAAKGMYKEALVFWENHVQHTQPPYVAQDQYLFWMIQTNDQAHIQKNLNAVTVQQLDKQYPKLAAVLGLLVLTEHPELEQNLPQDSAFIAHLKIAQTALQAYHDKDINQLQAALSQLPYRSAFRDLRSLLKVCVVMPDSIAEAKALLTKIPANSAYSQAAKLLLAATKDGAELVAELTQCSHQQYRIICNIKGLNKQQQAFIQQCIKQQDKLTDKEQFKLVIKNRALLGTEAAQHFCQSILISYPAGKKEFNKYFDKISDYEDNRIKALSFEQQNKPYDADYHWRNCLHALNSAETNQSLKAALILRRMASKEREGEVHTDLLIESLEHDPSDRKCYLQIVHYYSLHEDTAKEYKLWLKKALEQFPQDIEVLTQAVKAATRKQTYKKASQYAKQILTVDPLNTFAKQTLFSSYLAHAQRQMREKKYHLVEKEINQAEKLNIGKIYQQQVQLMRALLCFANEDKKQGLQRIIQELATRYKDPVNQQFKAVMEALLNNLPVAPIVRELLPVKVYLLSTQEFTQLMQQLNQYTLNQDKPEYLFKALEKIKGPLKKSLSEQSYSAALMLDLCKVLIAIEYFELLRHCARIAQQKWHTPIWIYYRVYAVNNGIAEDCSNLDIHCLQNASDVAAEEKDYATSALIEQFLGTYFDAQPGSDMGMFSDFFGFDKEEGESSEDKLEALFEHLSDDVLNRLNKETEALTKKLSPEVLVAELLGQVGNNKSLLFAIMKNPDIYSALMLVKAAEKLQIDIDVTVPDIIEAFDVEINQSSFPF